MASLKEALEYASKNPTSDFAAKLQQHVQSGAADAEAKGLGIDLAPIKSAAPIAAPQQAQADQPGFMKRVGQKIAGGARAVGSMLISSEKALGSDIAAAIGGNAFADDVARANQAMSDADLAFIKNVKTNRDAAIASGNKADIERYDGVLSNFKTSAGQSIQELFPALQKTNGQVVGDAAGVLLDTLTAGSYGTAAKGAKTGELLAKTAVEGSKVAARQTAKEIAKETAKRAAVGGAAGYGYDVAGNLQQGKTGAEALAPGTGAALGTAAPLAIGAIKGAVSVTKDQAPRLINSLIKPKEADFSYGKDPGRTVSELGITGNSLPDFADNIHAKKSEIGQQLGDIYRNNADQVIDASSQVGKIDDAIAEAAKGGKNNQGIVTTLTNIKDSLLYPHSIDADGNIVRSGTELMDLTKLTPEEAFNLKREIAARTQFTGRPSDDKTVNSVLKDIYGGLKEDLNKAVGTKNPEIEALNQQFADLTSAELATKNRDKIVQRQNLISMPIKVGGATALATSLATGGAAIPVLLAGAGAAALDKALASTAAKTRVAAWLGSQKPSVVKALLRNNPGITEVLYRTWPKIASQLGD